MLRITRIPPDEETVKAARREYTGDTNCRFTVDGETACRLTVSVMLRVARIPPDGEPACRFTVTVNRQFTYYSCMSSRNCWYRQSACQSADDTVSTQLGRVIVGVSLNNLASAPGYALQVG